MQTTRAVKCSNCRNTRFQTVPHKMVADVDGAAYTAMCEAQQCTECVQRILNIDDHEQFVNEIVKVIAKEGRIGPEAFRKLRRHSGVAAQDLARWLEVTPTTVSRWENSKRPAPRAAFIVLSIIALEHIEGETKTRDTLDRSASVRASIATGESA